MACLWKGKEQGLAEGKSTVCPASTSVNIVVALRARILLPCCCNPSVPSFRRFFPFPPPGAGVSGNEKPPMKTKVLIVDDDPSMRTALMESVRRLGYDVQGAIDGADALDRIVRFRPWLVLTDLKMPRMTGLDFIKEVKARAPQTLIVLMTAYGTVETAVEAMKHGASEYLLKPFSMELLERVIANLKEGRDAGTLSGAGRPEQRTILTQDPGMIRLLSTVEGVAASQATVLINGESGTGKELLARFIHSRSPRAHRPFIAVNCAALPDGLLESELFGHERGAFTGALVRKIGKFEMAHTGTLLLDEISEMNLGLQAKLLRVLQEREVDRVGGRDPVPVNIRVIATTNRALYREVEQGRFREDLYYRLNVFPVTVPPLRERAGDIPLLARHFASLSAARNGLAQPSVSEAALLPSGCAYVARRSAYHGLIMRVATRWRCRLRRSERESSSRNCRGLRPYSARKRRAK